MFWLDKINGDFKVRQATALGLLVKAPAPSQVATRRTGFVRRTKFIH